MNTNSRRKNRGKAGKTRSNVNPSTSALSYSGPTLMNQEQLSVVDLCYDTPATSSAAGVIADDLADYPLASPDWAGVSATFAEYRVLAMEVRFIPNVTGATIGTLLYAPIYLVLDLTSNVTPLTSYAQATNYALSTVRSLNQLLRMQHKMKGVEESQFVPTTSGVVDYSFKTFAGGLTPSTTYGRYFVHWKCQFRGRL